MYMDGAVFAQTDNSLICLDAKDGRKIWKSDYSTSTPCSGKGAFYFWSKGSLHKFSLAKNVATKVWQKKVDTIFHIFLEGDKVYAVGSAKFFCLSAKDSSYVWSTALADAGVPSSNLQVVIAKGLLFFANPFYFAHTFYCVGDATALSTDCNWPTSNGNPWHTGEVGAGCGPKNGSIELLWKSWSGDQATMPVIVGNKVFTVSSTGKMLQCLDIGTGKPIWTKQIEAYALMAYSDGLLYVNDITKLFCVDSESGKELWSKEADTGTTPALQGDLLYVTSPSPSGRITCRYTQNGKVSWIKDLSAPISTEPLATSGKVFVGCPDKSFYCLDAYTGKSLWQVELPDSTFPTYQIAYFW